MGTGDDVASRNVDGEKAYPDVDVNPYRRAKCEYFFDPNFEGGKENDEDEHSEDEKTGFKYDDVDEDSPIIHFDNENPTIHVGTIFENVRGLQILVATFAIRAEFEYIIEKSDQERLRVRNRDKACKWQLHKSPMRGGYPFQVATI
jgi:hypothetical protein